MKKIAFVALVLFSPLSADIEWRYPGVISSQSGVFKNSFFLRQRPMPKSDEPSRKVDLHTPSSELIKKPKVKKDSASPKVVRVKPLQYKRSRF